MACVSKRFCVISSILATVVALAFIGSIIYIVIKLQASKESPTPGGNETSKLPFISFSEGLIYTTLTNEIWAWDIPSGNTLPLVTNVSDTIVGFDYYGNQTVYYSALGSRHPIVSASVDCENLVYPGEGWYATALAVDSLGGNLYVYDSQGLKIDLFNVKSQKYGILMADVKGVKDIAVDPYRGLIFLLYSKSISMAKMDDMNFNTIVKEDSLEIGAFTLDLANTMLYWGTSTHISRYNYIDEKLTVVTEAKCLIRNIGILHGSIYTTCENKGNGKDSATKNALHYILDNGKSKVFDGLNWKDVQKLKVYGPGYLPEPKTVCSKNNGGCEHFCLPGYDRHTCACAVGWTLNKTNDLSCDPANEYLAYLKDNYVRGKVFDPTKEAIVPRSTQQTILEEKNIIEVDFDARRNYLIYSDDHGLYRVNLNSNGTSQVQLGYLKDAIILSPAVDWIGNQIYYFRYNASDEFTSLMVQEAEQFSDTQNQRELYRFELGLEPNALVLAQHRGLLFFIMYDESSQKPQLWTLTTTGVDLTVLTLPGEYTMSKVALAIDYDNDRFYWFDEARERVHTNLVNGTIASFDVSIVKNPEKISIHGSRMYISSSQGTHYFSKLDGSYGDQVLFSGPTTDSWLSAAKIISERQQPIRDHPCAKDNGGCQRYCFALPNGQGKLTRECACNDNESLKDDDMGCVYKPSYPIGGIPGFPGGLSR